MGNKPTTSHAAVHGEDENKEAPLAPESGDNDQEAQKPTHQRTKRARKVLRQTSVAVKKAVVTNATVTDIQNVDVSKLSADTMELILTNKNLKKVPDEVVYMKQLLVLNLCGNEIPSIPPEIGTVKTIVKLLLAGNQIASIPDEISNLSALEELVLADNPNLSSLPSTLPHCGNLHLLNIAKCKFTELPPIMASMVALSDFNISSNDLGKADLSDIASMIGLRVLVIANCKLKQLPDQIGSLSGLRELDVSQNSLKTVPDAISDLHELTSLDISENKFTAIPDSICDIVSLRKLSVVGNLDIVTIPTSLRQLKRLKTLLIDWSLLANLNLREYQDKSVSELMAYLKLLSDVETGTSSTTSTESVDESRRILLENYARIVEKNKSRQMGKSDLYRALGLEGLPENDIVERLFGALDKGSQSSDGLIAFEEYASGVELLLKGSLEQKAEAFLTLFTPGPDHSEASVDQYVKSIKSFQWIISVAILIQEKSMQKSRSSKRSSAPRGPGSSGLKSKEKEDICAIVNNVEFWRTPELTRLMEEAQETFDAIDAKHKSVITKSDIVKFMKQYEGNEVEETLKQVAGWLTNGVFQSPELLVAKASEYAKMGNLELAREYYKDAIEASPSRLTSYEALMQFYRQQGQFEKALKVGQMALKVDQNALFILDLIGRIQGDAKQLQEAINTFQKIVDADPNAAGSIYRQAWYYVILGNYKGAQANVALLDNLKYDAGAAAIRYMVSRATKSDGALVQKLGKRALKLNQGNALISHLVSTPYDASEDTQKVFGF